jgi:hypothetical protein
MSRNVGSSLGTSIASWAITFLERGFAMTVLADFQVIQSAPVEIGDPPDGVQPWVSSFNTGGRLAEHKAFITLMVQGLNRSADVEVEVNNKVVGKIFRTIGPDTNWHTQIMIFDGSFILHGDNRILIKAVPSEAPEVGDLFQNFKIMSVMCFFRQDSD